MRQQYAWRSMLLNGFLAFVAALVVLQMVRIQASAEAEQFRKQANAFAGEYKTFYPERGEIYDRNGHLLAGNRTVYEVGVDLNTVRDPHSIAMASVSISEKTMTKFTVTSSTHLPVFPTWFWITMLLLKQSLI